MLNLCLFILIFNIVADSLNNLATLYADKGNYEEALPLYKRALKIYET